MNNTIDQSTLFSDQGFTQGQMAVLNKIRYSLSNIWSNLALESQGEALAIGFSACSRGDGSSFVALHMALLLAHDQQLKTLYVDADIEKPRPKNGAAVPGAAHEGLKQYLAGEKDLHELIKPTEIEEMHAMASGIHSGKQLPLNMHKQTRYIEQLLEDGRRDYDAVIFDLPPLSMSPWALSVGRLLDSVVIVCRYAQSRRQVCMHGLEKVNKHGVPLAGMILNERDYPIPMSIYNWLK